MAFLLSFYGKIKGWLALAGAVIIAVLIAFFKGRSAGKAAEAAKAQQARIDSMKTAKEVTDEVSNLGNNDVDRELSQWMRDKRR